MKKVHLHDNVNGLEAFMPSEMVPKRYSFDTSAFIETWRHYQPIDVFPKVWEDLANVIAENRILCSIIVQEELRRKDDDLLHWVLERVTFLEPTKKEEAIVISIISDAHFSQWAKGRKNQADPFVVALGKVNKCPVVTWEHTFDRTLSNTLASACKLQGVEAISFVEFQRREQFRYA